MTTGTGSPLPERGDAGDLQLRSLARDSGVGLSRQLASMGLSIVAAIITARTLGPEGQGAYTLALLLPYVALVLTGLGIARATTYFVSRGDHTVGQALRGTLALVLRVAPLGYLLVGALIWIRDLLPFDPFGGMPSIWLVVASTMLLLTLLQNSLLAILQGRQRFASYQLGILIPQAAGALFLFVVLVLGNGGVLAAISAAVAAQLLGLAITARSVLGMLEAGESSITWRLEPSFAASIRSYGLRAYVGSVVNFLSFRVDIILIGVLLGTTAPIGLYAIAYQWAERLWFLSNAISVVLLPRIAELGADAEDTRRRLTPIVARHVLWLSIIPAAVLAIVAPLLVTTLYGEEFAGAALPLQLLLPGIVIWNVSRILTSDLGGRGRPGLSATVDAGGLAMNIALNLALIPPFGIVGAALASSASYAASTVVKSLIYSGVSGVPWWRLFVPSRSDFERLARRRRVRFGSREIGG